MQFITPTNDPFARIGFAKTYGELTDEYNYSAAPKYEAEFSNFLCGKRCKARKAAELEAKKAKTSLDQELAKAINAPVAGMGTGAKIAIGVGIVAVLGATIWFLKK